MIDFRTAFPLAMVLMLGTPAAWARLGESRAQCIGRYGEPLAEVPALLEGATGATFQRGPIRIRIEFLGDKAAFLSFSRKGLGEEERQKLLEVNAGPLVWNPPGVFLGRKCWTAPGTALESSRHASGYVAADTTYLDIATDEWTRQMRTQQAAQFAIKPRAPSTPSATAPLSPVPIPPAATGNLEGF
jgi:hypothetical protein